MPVLVTAADTTLGTALVRRLLATGGQVRAWCSAGGNSGLLRSSGAIVATGDVDDVGRLEAACEQVHTVIHLGGGLLSSSAERIISDTDAVVTAAANAGAQRLVLLSIVGASPTANDELRRAKHAAEALVAAGEVPSVVVRSALVVTGNLAEVLVGTPLPPHVAGATVRTVDPDRLVEVIAMLDEMRSETERGHATLVAQGGHPIELESLLGERAGTRGVYQPLERTPLLVAALAGPWTDEDPLTADAWGLTGIEPRVEA